MIRQSIFHHRTRPFTFLMLISTLLLSACDSSVNTTAEKPTLVVSILSPTASTFNTTSTTRTTAEVAPFEGSANDAVDGELTGDSLVWTYVNQDSGLEYNFDDKAVGSSIATTTTGPGTGSYSKITKEFPAGRYTVRLTATNSRGESKTAEKSIFINRMPISVNILAPKAGEKILYIKSEDNKDNWVQLAADVYDPEDQILTGRNIQWHSKKITPELPIEEQAQLQLFATGERTAFPFTPGLYTLWVLAKDSENAVIGKKIRFSVVTDKDGGGGSIPNAPPVVTIAQPLDTRDYEFGGVIPFSGSATDVEDGNLTGTSLVWSSNIDGLLGYGNSRTCATSNPTPCEKPLSPGNHTIVLKATDSGFLSASASVNITVTKPPPGNGEPPIDPPPTNLTAMPFIDIGLTKGEALPNSIKLNISASDNIDNSTNPPIGGLTGYYIAQVGNGGIPSAPSPTGRDWDTITGANFSTTVTYDLNTYPLGTDVAIYVWFKDTANQLSAYATDTIAYADVVKPINNMTTPFINVSAGAGAPTYSKNVYLSLNATDLWGVTAFYVAEATTSGTPATPAVNSPKWINVAETTNYNKVTAYSLQGNYLAPSNDIWLTVWFKDANNNISSASQQDTITYIPYIANEDFNIGNFPTTWAKTGDWTSVNAANCKNTPDNTDCAATGSGNYVNQQSIFTSPTYTLPRILASEKIVLNSEHWYSFYSRASGGGRGSNGMNPVYDYGYFEISVNGGTWTTLQTFSQTSPNNNWGQLTQQLASYASTTSNNSVRFRFRLQPATINSTQSSTYPGWYLNNFTIKVQ